MYSYICKTCGYVYDPDEGDDDQGVPPDTPFDEVPGDWSCPNCGADKSQFEQF